MKKRAGSIGGLVALAFGALGAVREMRAASGKKDRLALVNAAANVFAVCTGAALVIRSMRAGDSAGDGEES